MFQKPAQLVFLPHGAAHFVCSYGPLMTQVAWNHISGAVQCLSYWGIDDNHEHFAHGNTSMTTILSLMTMQSNGYELGLMDQLQQYQELIKKIQSTKKYCGTQSSIITYMLSQMSSSTRLVTTTNVSIVISRNISMRSNKGTPALTFSPLQGIYTLPPQLTSTVPLMCRISKWLR